MINKRVIGDCKFRIRGISDICLGIWLRGLMVVFIFIEGMFFVMFFWIKVFLGCVFMGNICLFISFNFFLFLLMVSFFFDLDMYK